MAKVTAPLHSIQASGKVDGLVYSRNQYGAYTRSAGSWVDPNTVDQQSWRNAMGTINTQWQTLASTQPWVLQNWMAFASTHTVANRLGQQKRLSAKSWFVRQNSYRVVAGLSTQNLPPDPYPGNYWPEVYFIWHTDGIYVDAWPRPTGEQLIYVSKVPYQSQARFFCPNLTQKGIMISASTTLPYRLWTIGEVGTAARRWFFKWVQVDQQGSHGSPVYDWIDTEGNAPKAFYNISQDTWLQESASDSIRGLTSTIHLSSITNALINSIFEIDLSGKPAIDAKKFLVFYKFDFVVTQVGYMRFHNMLVSWNEAQSTWNNRLTGTPWSSPGMAAGTDYESDSFFLQKGDDIQSDWNRWDITRLANRWLTGGLSNNGWCGIADAAGFQWVYNSINDGTSADRPYAIALFG